MWQHSPRAFPLGVAAPVGTLHGTHRHSRLPRARRPRSRICFRKGCGRKYQPRRWNQRYCQDSECLREVHRWQAARRQAKRRRDDRIRTQHAQAEKERRQQAKAAVKIVEAPKLRLRMVTQQKFFFSPFMRSARLPRIPGDLAPQPSSLLLHRLPAGGSQCPGSRT